MKNTAKNFSSSLSAIRENNALLHEMEPKENARISKNPVFHGRDIQMPAGMAIPSFFDSEESEVFPKFELPEPTEIPEFEGFGDKPIDKGGFPERSGIDDHFHATEFSADPPRRADETTERMEKPPREEPRCFETSLVDAHVRTDRIDSPFADQCEDYSNTLPLSELLKRHRAVVGICGNRVKPSQRLLKMIGDPEPVAAPPVQLLEQESGTRPVPAIRSKTSSAASPLAPVPANIAALPDLPIFPETLALPVISVPIPRPARSVQPTLSMLITPDEHPEETKKNEKNKQSHSASLPAPALAGRLHVDQIFDRGMAVAVPEDFEQDFDVQKKKNESAENDGSRQVQKSKMENRSSSAISPSSSSRIAPPIRQSIRIGNSVLFNEESQRNLSSVLGEDVVVPFHFPEKITISRTKTIAAKAGESSGKSETTASGEKAVEKETWSEKIAAKNDVTEEPALSDVSPSEAVVENQSTGHLLDATSLLLARAPGTNDEDHRPEENSSDAKGSAIRLVRRPFPRATPAGFRYKPQYFRDNAESAVSMRQTGPEEGEMLPVSASVSIVAQTVAIDCVAAIEQDDFVKQSEKRDRPAIEQYGEDPVLHLREITRQLPLTSAEKTEQPVIDEPPIPSAPLFYPSYISLKVDWPDSCEKLMNKAAGQFRGLASLLQHGKRHHRAIVAYTGYASGDGTTTLAIGTARELAAQQERVLLIDLNCENPALLETFGVETDQGWNVLLSPEMLDLHESMPPLIRLEPDGVYLLPLCRADVQGARNFLETFDAAEVIRHFTGWFDHIVIDAGALEDCDLASKLETFSRFAVDAILLIRDMKKTATIDYYSQLEQIDRQCPHLLGIAENHV